MDGMVSILQKQIRVCEIFYSIQGESTFMGLPCIFVRSAGCDLRCTWCDTSYSFKVGEKWDIAQILQKIKTWPCNLVELTGGEPLLQPHIPELAEVLLEKKYTVLCETGGHRDIGILDRRVIKVMDIKCPGSGESHRNFWPNLDKIEAKDQVKFVIKDRADYEWALAIVKKYDLEKGPIILFSPVFGELEYSLLAEWVLQDGVRARMQLQLHKFIWDPEKRGV